MSKIDGTAGYAVRRGWRVIDVSLPRCVFRFSIRANQGWGVAMHSLLSCTLHPLTEIWSLLPTKKQHGDSHNAKWRHSGLTLDHDASWWLGDWWATGIQTYQFAPLFSASLLDSNMARTCATAWTSTTDGAVVAPPALPARSRRKERVNVMQLSCSPL